jgi:uncharacterized NAD(P)/FAD-binding protein YdhS
MLSRPQHSPRRSERPAEPRRPTVAIVGAGASGLLLATHLLRASSAGRRASLRAVLIDRQAQDGGIAYSTSDPNHRLNVTAARMSALPEAPDDFVRWRARAVGESDPGAYAPRGEYRRYLSELLGSAERRAAPGVTLERWVGRVVAVEPLDTHVRIRVAGGEPLDAEVAVLALGNLRSLTPPGCDGVSAHAAYVGDPWAPGALDRLDPGTRGLVLLVGTGLTMVDVALAVSARCPRAHLMAVSRRGLLPRAHLPGRVTPRPAPVALDAGASLPVLVETVLAEASAGHAQWHGLVDDLRPATQDLWKRLTLQEQASFLATHHRAWCVHRHRMPPEVAAMLAELLHRRRLQVRGGSIVLAARTRNVLEARISGADPLTVAAAINCTGPGLDPRASEDPLIGQLLGEGHVAAHPLGTGFDTAPDGSFRSSDGTASRRLFTLGPPRIGELYETTAIPEIREQARALAELLAARVAAAPRPGTSVTRTARDATAHNLDKTDRPYELY